MSNPLLIVGIDGATFDLLTPWLEVGQLPVLAQLQANGSHGLLASTLPPVTAPAWVSFMTGKTLAQHGIHDFFVSVSDDLDNFRLVNSGDIKAKTVWEIASEGGKSVGVLNVPVTYPPRPVNGYLVPGLLAPDQGETTYPPNFLKPYTSHLGCYRLTPDLLYQPGNEAEFIADLMDVTERQIAYALHLAHEHPTDVLMLHFLATDIMQHKLWHIHDVTHPRHTPELARKFGNALLTLYQKIDKAIGRLVGIFTDSPNVIVMSDHGFGRMSRTINLNLALTACGLLRFKRGVGLRRWLNRSRLGTAIGQRLWRRDHLLSYADVDWNRTVAYSRGHMGQIYLTERGAGRSEEVAETLRQFLMGIGVSAEITSSSAGPDLHICCDNYETIAYPLFSADGNILTVQQLGDSGNHRSHGILLAAGPDIAPHITIANARLIDLAPTMLHLLGILVPDDMSGIVLEEMLSAEFRATHPLQYQQTTAHHQQATALNEQESAVVADQLRALGYLD